MAGSGPGGEPGAAGDDRAAPERTRKVLSPRQVRRSIEIQIEEVDRRDEKERYVSAIARAADDSPREVAAIYLRSALPDVLQSLVRKAKGRGAQSVSAARVICDLLGIREVRAAAKAAIVEPQSAQQDEKELAEFEAIHREIEAL